MFREEKLAAYTALQEQLEGLLQVRGGRPELAMPRRGARPVLAGHSGMQRACGQQLSPACPLPAMLTALPVCLPS